MLSRIQPAVATKSRCVGNNTSLIYSGVCDRGLVEGARCAGDGIAKSDDARPSKDYQMDKQESGRDDGEDGAMGRWYVTLRLDRKENYQQ